MRKLHVTPAATDFHVDLDVHQNTVAGISLTSRWYLINI